jgi:para-nitrobenzyl esterase
MTRTDAPAGPNTSGGYWETKVLFGVMPGKAFMRTLRFSLVILSLLLFIPTVGAGQTATPTVRIASGEVRGEASGNLMIFKGIPFAAPPVASLRWRPPQPVQAWKGVRSAMEFGNECMQFPSSGNAAPLRAHLSEDCLYLNVWAPAHPANKSLPVMVWIHGGGFVNGGSSPVVFDGSHFADRGVVFVSINYRLGRFGFFAFPALKHEGGMMGNYAFMDQIAALKWVKNNIAAFGGNPNHVTIFGESAGGMSVNFLLTSPLARGLFQQAMVESGGGRNTILPPTPLDQPGAPCRRRRS